MYHAVFPHLIMASNYNITDDVLHHYGGTITNDLTHIMESASDEYEPNVINHSSYYSASDMPSHIHSSYNNFTLLSLNAQSINSKISKLQLLVHQLKLQNINLDAIAIQESWLPFDDDHEHSDLSQLSIDGYSIKSQGYSCSKHGGLMFYIRSDYTVKKIKSIKESDIWEGLFVEIAKESNSSKIILGNVYKPPKQNNNLENVQQFTNELLPILDKLNKKKAEFLVAGDYNINLLKINEREGFADFFRQNDK